VLGVLCGEDSAQSGHTRRRCRAERASFPGSADAWGSGATGSRGKCSRAIEKESAANPLSENALRHGRKETEFCSGAVPRERCRLADHRTMMRSAVDDEKRVASRWVGPHKLAMPRAAA